MIWRICPAAPEVLGQIRATWCSWTGTTERGERAEVNRSWCGDRDRSPRASLRAARFTRQTPRRAHAVDARDRRATARFARSITPKRWRPSAFDVVPLPRFVPRATRWRCRARRTFENAFVSARQRNGAASSEIVTCWAFRRNHPELTMPAAFGAAWAVREAGPLDRRRSWARTRRRCLTLRCPSLG